MKNVDIRSINLLRLDSKNLDHIEYWFSNGGYGVVIDVIKYEILRSIGGIILDINYKITTSNLEEFLNSYSFL